MSNKQSKAKNEKQWEQEFEEFGNEAVNRVKGMVSEGKVRRLVIRKPDDDVLLDVPLLPAAMIGGVMTFWMPYMTILGVVVAFVAKIKVDIVHVETIGTDTENIEITS